MSNNNLMNCPSCQKEVSKSANNCPHCGEVLRKPKRGFFGKIVIWAFWGFNLLMVIWIWGGTQSAVETSQGLSGAEAAGAAIGTGIGFTLLVIIWLIGTILLGIMSMLTRPK